MSFGHRAGTRAFLGALSAFSVILAGCSAANTRTPMATNAFVAPAPSLTTAITALSAPTARVSMSIQPVNNYTASRAMTSFDPKSEVAPSAVKNLQRSLASSSQDLRVMTFNLRVATAIDGLNTWEFRKGQVVERVRDHDPDLLGTQEGLNGMEKYLREKLTDYTFFGVGRDDGKTGGEFCGMFFKTAKFEKLDSGNFWLSTHPEKPGSHGWGAWFPRMVSWVKLQPRDGSPAFYWFNTHFDAFASKARTESAKLLLTRMATLATSAPCIVTGDFNADASARSAPYNLLLAGKLTDAFRAANPIKIRDEGTRHDFNGHKDGDRIDWIMTTPDFKPLIVEIDRTRGVLGYPSDHFPVSATLRLNPMTPTPATPAPRQPGKTIAAAPLSAAAE